MDQVVTIERRFRLEGDSATAWAEEENRKARVCACGCGGAIRVLARHRWHGVPSYVRGHHPMRMTREVAELRAGGGMTTAQAAAALGIGETTLLRMEGVAYPVVPRVGGRGMRVFSVAAVEQARQNLLQCGGRAVAPHPLDGAA